MLTKTHEPQAPIIPPVDLRQVHQQLESGFDPTIHHVEPIDITPEQEQEELEQLRRDALLELDLDTEPKIYLFAAEELVRTIDVHHGYYTEQAKHAIEHNIKTKREAALEIVYAYSRIDEIQKAKGIIDEFFPDDEKLPELKDFRALAFEILLKGSGYSTLEKEVKSELSKLGFDDPELELATNWLEHRREDMEHVNPKDSVNGHTDGRYKPTDTIQKFVQGGVDTIKDVVDGARNDKRARTALNVTRAISEFAVGRQNYLLANIT